MTPNIKNLITRLENAIYAEAMAEARDASDATLRLKSEATNTAKRELTTEFQRLQQRVAELELGGTTIEQEGTRIATT